jgi:hypothetical protein
MTATLTVRPSKAEVRPHLPAVRVRPAPPLEPPFDDERGPAAWERLPMPLSVRAPELPFELPARVRARAPRPGRSQRPQAGPLGPDRTASHPVSRAAAGRAPAGLAPDGRASVGLAPEGRTPLADPATPGSGPATVARSSLLVGPGRAGRPGPELATLGAAVAAVAVPVPSTLDARRATRRFLSACLEVIGGYRPLSHLRPLCRPDRYALVAERLGGRKGTGQRNLGGVRPQAVGGRMPSGSPPRAGRGNSAGPGDRVGVLRVQVGEPRQGVAEVAVVLIRRERVWAMAFRLEESDGRWLCTHLEVL